MMMANSTRYCVLIHVLDCSCPVQLDNTPTVLVSFVVCQVLSTSTTNCAIGSCRSASHRLCFLPMSSIVALNIGGSSSPFQRSPAWQSSRRWVLPIATNGDVTRRVRFCERHLSAWAKCGIFAWLRRMIIIWQYVHSFDILWNGLVSIVPRGIAVLTYLCCVQLSLQSGSPRQLPQTGVLPFQASWIQGRKQHQFTVDWQTDNGIVWTGVIALRL